MGFFNQLFPETIFQFFPFANNVMQASFYFYQITRSMSSQLGIFKHSASPRVRSEGHCFISDIYLAYCKPKDFLKVSGLTYEEQIEGPASAKVCHDDCVNWHRCEKSLPGSTKFLGRENKKQRHF